MEYIKRELASAVEGLSDKNYEQSLDFYRLWFDIGRAHADIQPTQTLEDIWAGRGPSTVNPGKGQLFHPAAHLILRFARDLESDPALGPLSAGLQSRLCARLLQSFFGQGMIGACQRGGKKVINGSSWKDWDLEDTERSVASDSNLIALWANLGYVEETAIRNRILQSLISFPKLYNYQADAMIVLFKIAGATFEAYADPAVVDRCFELLKNHYSPGSVKGRLVQVSVLRTVGDCSQTDENLKEVLELRERGWEGLPPPPIFTSTKAKSAGASKEDPSATPIVTSLGLPSTDLEPQVTLPSPTEPAAAPETETAPESPVTQSPSISIATLSDFTIADTPDDESPVDPAAVTPHETFYLEDGNVEVLCDNTLFRVHTSILSFHSPALRQMLSQTSLASTESPNGCPRILSSDTATDFATLLKMIYLPRCAALRLWRGIVWLTFAFTDSLSGTKRWISPRFRLSSESQQSTRCPLSDLIYSTSSAMRTQRRSKESPPPNHLEKPPSADRLLIQTKSSISSSSRNSHPHCRWHTTWRLEGG